jgi:hypothetical protein
MMFGALVVVDAVTGTMTRYETGGKPRRTHSGTVDRAATFEPDQVEGFRRSPPSRLRIIDIGEPDPPPSSPPPRAGRNPKSAA